MSSSSSSSSSSSIDSSSQSSGDTNWLPGWNKRIRFQIDSSKVDASLSNFPTLLKLSNSSGVNSKDVTEVFDELGNNSKKIAVTTRDGVTQCYVEIESWLGDSPIESNSGSSSSSEEGRIAYLWFKAPYIRHSENEIFYLYYDNSHDDNTDYVGDVNSVAGANVWDSRYKGVWHISEGGTGTRYDSTSNNNDGTPQNYDGDEAVTGKIDGADDLDGVNDYVEIDDDASLDITDKITLACWANVTVTGTYRPLITKWQTTSNQKSYDLYITSAEKAAFAASDDGAEIDYRAIVTTATIPAGQWVHVVATFATSDNSAHFYFNGVMQALSTDSGNVKDIHSGSSPVRLGEWGPGASIPYTGCLDECRIINAALTPSEIKADYNSGNDSLIIFGDEEDLSSSSSSSSIDSSLIDSSSSSSPGEVFSESSSSSSSSELYSESSKSSESSSSSLGCAQYYCSTLSEFDYSGEFAWTGSYYNGERTYYNLASDRYFWYNGTQWQGSEVVGSGSEVNKIANDGCPDGTWEKESVPMSGSVIEGQCLSSSSISSSSSSESSISSSSSSSSELYSESSASTPSSISSESSISSSSSSSSIGYSSSSSSIGYSSNSSYSSSLSSSMGNLSLSSSSIDSSSSSSSSIDSSSSSSSSYLDYNDKKTLPFMFEVEVTTPIWGFAFHNQDVYAGTGSDGILLKSTDRNFWSKIYAVDDIHISALGVQNDILFIGTSPKGKVYLRDLNTDITVLSYEFSGTISKFVYFKNTMYAAISNPSSVYSFDTETSQWNFVYKPYGSSVTDMFVANNKLQLFMDSENFISFDGDTWTINETGNDNISSFRRVSKEPFSHIEFQDIERSEVRGVNSLDNEEIFDIYPINYSSGLKSADSDGGSLVVGTSEYGRIYSYYDNSLHPIFQTESGNTVNDLLNIAKGVNLAAIDDRLYLIYCGSLDGNETTTTTTTLVEETTTTTTLPITVTSPSGGESFQTGETVTIQWVSNRSYNDAVKIDLYQEGEVERTINPNTLNNGSYQWIVPADLLPGLGFKIGITWLSSGNNDGPYFSSGTFSVGIAATTTTSTTTPLDPTIPDIEECRGILLLQLLNNEQILVMVKDNVKGGILFGTSKGRILTCDELIINGYLTGERKVYAEVKDGFGNISDTGYADFFYALYNKIAEINEDKEVVKYKFIEDASAIMSDRITATFLSPILNVKEDLGFWKQLMWKESKPDNTEIIICVRAADSLDDLKLMPWDYCFVSRDSDNGYGSTGYITRNLMDVDVDGKYFQFKVMMTTDSKNITPTMLEIVLSYSTKFAVYFFTTKFSLLKDSNVKTGMIVGQITEPKNTEVHFGITNMNSADWNNYTPISVDKFFSLDNYNNVKVGIRMVAYDDEYPEVGEFALLTGSEKDNMIN